jgi:hypothetical protein
MMYRERKAALLDGEDAAADARAAFTGLQYFPYDLSYGTLGVILPYHQAPIRFVQPLYPS